MIERLDVANLVALHVLLEERSVSRAARRLGLTQSSMSHRLGRLRDSLRDPLFVRAGRALVPTPRAEAIGGPLAAALASLDAVVTPPPPFDPSTSTFEVSIVVPDLLAPLVPRTLVSMSAIAPNVSVRVASIGPGFEEGLAAGDPCLALVPMSFAPRSMKTRFVGDLRFGVVGRREHPALRRRLTVERWLAYDHVVVRVGVGPANVVTEALARLGVERRVGLEVPSFLMGLLTVAESDLLMNAPVPLVHDVAKRLALVVRDAPVAIPRVRFAMIWHERFHLDPANRWARERIFHAVRPLFDATADAK